MVWKKCVGKWGHKKPFIYTSSGYGAPVQAKFRYTPTNINTMEINPCVLLGGFDALEILKRENNPCKITWVQVRQNNSFQCSHFKL